MQLFPFNHLFTYQDSISIILIMLTIANKWSGYSVDYEVALEVQNGRVAYSKRFNEFRTNRSSAVAVQSNLLH